MATGIEISGMGELFKSLDLTQRKINDAANGALREGGGIVQDAIIDNTPFRNGTAQGDVHVGNVSSADFNKQIKIGYGGASYWYMWFLEEGTYSKGNPKGIAPQNNVQRAWQGSYTEAFDTMAGFLASRGLT